MSDTKSNVPDKGRNSTSGAPSASRNSGSHGSGHGSKQRTRVTGGLPTSKLAVPRPVILPSLRKENEGSDVPSHVAAAPMGGSGRQRPDGQAALEHETWSQHVAPKNVSWHKGLGEHEGRSFAGGHFVPVLDQEEFPSLEDATHGKGHPPAKARIPNRDTGTHLEDKDNNQEWIDEDQAQSMSQPYAQHMAWEEDERFGGVPGEMHVQYGVSGPMQHPGFAPVGSHGFPPSDPYLQPHYYHPHPPFYSPHPSGMRPNFRIPEFYGQTGSNVYAPYYRPMYPMAMPHGYHHPEVYSDQMLFSAQPPPPPEMQFQSQENPMTVPLNFSPEKDDFEKELQSLPRKLSEHLRFEAEHPKTPDNVSGEGTVRTITRQQSVGDHPRDVARRAILLKPSLAKDSAPHPLGARGPSIDMDWDAQVDAEEQRVIAQKDLQVSIAAAAKEAPAPETSARKSEAYSPGALSRSKARGSGRPEYESRDQFSSSHSPLRSDRQQSQAESADNGERGSVEASDRETPLTWRSGRQQQQHPRGRSHDRWRGGRSRSRRFGSHGSASQMDRYRPDHGMQDHWGSSSDFPSRGRFSRGRGRGRSRWNDSADRPSRDSGHLIIKREKREAPVVAQGRKHFPGRGFRPQGPLPRREALLSDASEALASVQTEPAQETIHFGQFPVSLGDSFDLVTPTSPNLLQSHQTPTTTSPEIQTKQHDEARDRTQETSVTGMTHDAQREADRVPLSVGPAQMDLTSSTTTTPYVETILPNSTTDNGAVFMPHQSSIDDDDDADMGLASRPSDQRRNYRGRDYSRGFQHRERGRGRWHGGRYGGRSVVRPYPPSTTAASASCPMPSPTAAANGSSASDIARNGGPNQRFPHRRDFHSHRGGRTDWNRQPRDGGEGSEMHHAKKPGGRGRGGRRGRGRDGGRHHRSNSHQRFQDPSGRSSSSQSRVQWVPKKSSADDGADQQTE